MLGVSIGIIVMAAIGIVHYQVAIAPMADKHSHIIKKAVSEWNYISCYWLLQSGVTYSTQ